jgi:hypothetical protein
VGIRNPNAVAKHSRFISKKVYRLLLRYISLLSAPLFREHHPEYSCRVLVASCQQNQDARKYKEKADSSLHSGIARLGLFRFQNKRIFLRGDVDFAVYFGSRMRPTCAQEDYGDDSSSVRLE